MRKKVSIIGAGQVGTTAALQIIAARLADVTLVDVVEGLAKGKALDLQQTAALLDSDCRVEGNEDFATTGGSDIIVITAGLARRPGMSRTDLLAKNAAIVRQVIEKTVPHSPEAVLITVTNPLDAITCIALEASGFDSHKVVGMGGVLDSARMQAFIAEELGVSISNVQACVIGMHGEKMLPLPRFSTMSGIPITSLLYPGKVQKIVERTINGGAEIVACLKQGSAFLAPGTSVAKMARAILEDEKRVLPCCAYLKGEYGINDVYLGVPAILGGEGVEDIIELDLDEKELEALQGGARTIREMLNQCRPQKS